MTHQFTVAELDANPWAACGPSACAALLGRSLADVRSAFPMQNDARLWVNFQQMLDALRSLGAHGIARRRHVDGSLPWPDRGLVLVQFGGAWDALPLNHPAQLAHTHWIAVKQTPEHGAFVFDVNSVGGMVSREGPGWDPREVWEAVMAPQIAEHFGTRRDGTPRANGKWWLRATIDVTS